MKDPWTRGTRASHSCGRATRSLTHCLRRHSGASVSEYGSAARLSPAHVDKDGRNTVPTYVPKEGLFLVSCHVVVRLVLPRHTIVVNLKRSYCTTWFKQTSTDLHWGESSACVCEDSGAPRHGDTQVKENGCNSVPVIWEKVRRFMDI